jgi:hypothetical protein
MCPHSELPCYPTTGALAHAPSWSGGVCQEMLVSLITPYLHPHPIWQSQVSVRLPVSHRVSGDGQLS